MIRMNALNQSTVGGLNIFAAGARLQTQNLIGLGSVHNP